MSKHTSNFRKIGQSGKTVDGRTIEKQWLLDIAETYSPKTYTAMIWPDHMRWFGNYGTVEEVEVREEGSELALYAKITPNVSYLWQNSMGQKLFFSMEIDPDFAGSGKGYLVGLAVTDNPASLGTEETRFSRKQSPTHHFIGNVPFEATVTTQGEEEAPSWFKTFLASFAAKKEPANEDYSMTPEQFEKLHGQLATMTTSVNAMTAKIEVLTMAKQASPSTTQATGDTPKTEGNVDLQAEQKTNAEMATVLLALDSMTKEFKAFSERLELAQAGTKAPSTTAPAGTDGIL